MWADVKSPMVLTSILRLTPLGGHPDRRASAGQERMPMGAKRKSDTPKYRREAAHLVIDTGRAIAKVAREIGVGDRGWAPQSIST